jgi:putative nucleotidyltransferase with HDIG domain
VLVVLLAVSPAVGLLAYGYLDARRLAAAEVQETVLRLARLGSVEHERLIVGTRYLLFALANDVRHYGPSACQPFFAELKRHYPIYANVGVVEPNGDIVCSGLPMPGPVNVADRTYFQRAVATRDFAAGEYQVGRITRRSSINFGYPVIASTGHIAGVAFAALDLAWITEAVARARLPEGRSALVVDRRGTVLARHPDTEIWTGIDASDVPVVAAMLARQEGTVTADGVDGVRRLYGFTPLGGGRDESFAVIAVGVPVQTAFAGVNRIAARNTAGLLVILVVVLAASLVGSDRLVLRPVNALIAAAARLGRGDLTARTGLSGSRGEVGQLATAFDDMAEALHRRDTELRAAEQQLRTALDDARRRLQWLQAMRAIDVAITRPFDLRATLNVVISKVITELRVHAADILLLDPKTGMLECVAGRGFRSPILQRPRVPMGEGHPGRAAAEATRAWIPDISKDPKAATELAIEPEEGFVTYCAVPLVSRDRVEGVLEVFHRTPVDPDAEWIGFLDALAGQAAIAIESALLVGQLQRAHADLARAYDATLEGWSRALDLRDQETEGHTQRVAEMTLRLAEVMGVPSEARAHIRRGALLHDIGKMGIPDRILLKPAPLSGDEWEIMRKHPTYAFDLLSPIEFLRPALDIPYAHHERWDGSGYPRGLKGEEIPLAARIFAVVDTWDALRSERPYRPAWSPERVKAYLRERAGRDFDPRVVEAFLSSGLPDGEMPGVRRARAEAGRRRGGSAAPAS